MNTAVRTDNASKADKRQPKIDANTRIISLHTWERNRENSLSLNDLTVKNQPELFISGSSGVNEGVLPCWLWLPIIDQHTTSATSSDAPVPARTIGIQIFGSLNTWLPKVLPNTKPKIWQQQTVTGWLQFLTSTDKTALPSVKWLLSTELRTQPL